MFTVLAASATLATARMCSFPVAEHRKARKSELLDRNILWIERGRVSYPWCLVLVSVKALRFARPRSAGLPALTEPPREPGASMATAQYRATLSRIPRFQVSADIPTGGGQLDGASGPEPHPNFIEIFLLGSRLSGRLGGGASAEDLENGRSGAEQVLRDGDPEAAEMPKKPRAPAAYCHAKRLSWTRA